MKCVNCGNEVGGKGKTCSDKCRKAISRASVTDDGSVTTPSVTNVTVNPDNVTVGTECDKIPAPNSITLTESDTLSSMALPNGTTSHYAVDVTLTTADIVAMSNDEAIALLYSWLQGKGTAYQYRVAVLAYKYSNIHGMANTWPIDSAALADGP